MALAISSFNVANASGATSVSTTAATPTANSLLLVCFGSFAGSAAPGTFSIADTFADTGGGSWTAFTGNNLSNNAGFDLNFGSWYREIGTGPASGKVTVTGSGSAQTFCLAMVDQVTGQNTTTPVPHDNGGDASFSATGSIALSTAPASTSLVWSGGIAAINNITPRVTTSGFTVSSSFSVATGNTFSTATEYIIGSGPTTVAWGGLSSGQENYLFVAEVAVGGGAPAFATRADLALQARNRAGNF